MQWLIFIILIICFAIAIKLGLLYYIRDIKAGGNEYYLEPVSKYNLAKLLQIKVNESQTTYVANIKDSLIQASFLKNWRGYILTDGDNVVGFGSIADYDKIPGATKIYKVIIDKHYQGKGLGKLLVDELITCADTPNLYIDVHNDNIAAMTLYKKRFQIVSTDDKNTVMKLSS